jgi:CNT family concentrative nucleoside transporter
MTAAALQSTLGIVALLAICWIISENRRAVSWRRVGASLLLTLLLAALLLNIPALKFVFAVANDAVNAIAAATRAGTSFVFGYLGGGPLPFEPRVPGSEFILALQALPVVLVVSVLTTLLFYWRILPPIARGFS